MSYLMMSFSEAEALARSGLMSADEVRRTISSVWHLEQRYSAEQRRWRAIVVAKVREGRLHELTPEERGWILSVLAAECPEVEA